MRLSDLMLVDPNATLLGADSIVSGIADDSREAKPGGLFAALPGSKADGGSFVQDALARGATSLLVARPISELTQVSQVVSGNVRRTLAHMASRWHGHPSHQMTVAGITGTNGKTTSAFLLRDVLRRCGVDCGLMGTVCNIVGNQAREARLTTPGPLQIQRMLSEMHAEGQRACTMEVSSHALDQQRAAGVRFAGAIFTNLTRDHLDYHRDFESYFAAKARLFEHAAVGVFNMDDDYGPRMRAQCGGKAVGFSLKAGAELRVDDIHMNVDGLTFSVLWRGRRLSFASPMTGRFNVQNLAGVIALALELGLDEGAIAAAIAGFRGAPGRLERVAHDGSGPTVFVDYAHTPDAMENVLTTLRRVCTGRVLTVVFGCGGDRDRVKRPQMGAIAAQYADRPIITSDNPRTEDPAEIIRQVLAGVAPNRLPVETCIDRREAIERAIAEAGPDEVIAILGKGHEDYQIFSDRTVHFDDKEEARAALARHWNAGASVPTAV